MFFRRSVLIFGTFFILAFIHSSAWAQAKVNENQETATLYVDATKGSDSNPGTQLQPLATIARPPVWP